MVQLGQLQVARVALGERPAPPRLAKALSKRWRKVVALAEAELAEAAAGGAPVTTGPPPALAAEGFRSERRSR